MERSRRAQIRLNLGSRLGANARSANRAFAPNVTNYTAYFPFSYMFAKRMTPMIRSSNCRDVILITNLTLIIITEYTKFNQTYVIYMHLSTYLVPVASLIILNLLNVHNLVCNLSLIFCMLFTDVINIDH